MMLLMSAMKNEPTTTPDSSSTRGIEPASCHEAEAVHQRHRAQRADEGRKRYGPRTGRSRRDREHGAESRTA